MHWNIERDKANLANQAMREVASAEDLDSRAPMVSGYALREAKADLVAGMVQGLRDSRVGLGVGSCSSVLREEYVDVNKTADECSRLARSIFEPLREKAPNLKGTM